MILPDGGDMNPDHYIIDWQGDTPIVLNRSGWEDELLSIEKVRAQTHSKAVCEEYILKRYPLTVQSSMSLGVYPADQKDTMVNFIASCVDEENRVFDLIESASTLEEVQSVIPSWPEV